LSARSTVNSVDVLKGFSRRDIEELYRFWAGKRGPQFPAAEADARESVLEWMGDLDVVEARVGELGRRMGVIFERVLAADQNRTSVSELSGAKEVNYLSSYDLEAALASLVRHGMLFASGPKANRSYCVPEDIALAVTNQRLSRRRGIFDAVTLKGHLDRMYENPSRKGRTSAAQGRMLYKVYAKESAAVARVDRLPDGLRGLVEKSILQFGGVLPRKLFERMDTDLPHWNRRRWAKILEESLVGTVERLDLTRYGIAHNDEALIVFTEVTLAWLKRVAVPSDPDKPAEEVSLGVDLASNISKFLSFLMENDVRFTVKGEIFKTTEKRILGELIPNPGREMERSEVLKFLFAFCRAHRLVEATGKRTFRVTSAGVEWEPLALEDKLKLLLDFSCEERPVAGEYFHQARMRRILLRLMKRVEAGTWYDIMYLPFLSRNTYLASLNELAVEDYFSAMQSGTGRDPFVDLQRLAWNLVSWVRTRLFLLGLVDLGYDSSGHPVAMRLTPTGARLFGAVSGQEGGDEMVGNLIVTPDFEVVLFASGDDGELVHDLDRFCHRVTSGDVMHFRIDAKGVGRALHEGASLARIIEILERNSRTPVPQNVLYSIRNWSLSAGLSFLSRDRVLEISDLETRRRLLQDPGVRPFVRRSSKEGAIHMKREHTTKRLRSILRELNYLVDLQE
jgi:hypothetical protein